MKGESCVGEVSDSNIRQDYKGKECERGYYKRGLRNTRLLRTQTLCLGEVKTESTAKDELFRLLKREE